MPFLVKAAAGSAIPWWLNLRMVFIYRYLGHYVFVLSVRPFCNFRLLNVLFNTWPMWWRVSSISRHCSFKWYIYRERDREGGQQSHTRRDTDSEAKILWIFKIRGAFNKSLASHFAYHGWVNCLVPNCWVTFHNQSWITSDCVYFTCDQAT